MFERYTEKARRVIFFSRYEATHFGSKCIETEHLLLGLLKEDTNLVKELAPDWPSMDQIVSDITKRVTIGESVPVTVDLPLSDECKHILSFAADEAERLNHEYISTEHLLLGMLREMSSLAAEMLHAHGINLGTVRRKIAPAAPQSGAAKTSPHLPAAGCVPDPETAIRIAEAVWIPIYGHTAVEQQRPLRADIQDDVWTVRGSPAPDQAADTLIAVLSKADGRILRIGISVFRRNFMS